MPIDAALVFCLKNELEDVFVGGKIDKIQQPSSDMLIFTVHTLRGTKKLLMSSGSGIARIHISNENYDNPKAPPMFCMLLRKHLLGAKITNIIQPNFERMVEICVTTRSELGVESSKRLIVELIGSASNIILVGDDNRIIDCIRRYGSAESERAMLPGMLYKYPIPQDKIKLCDFSLAAEEFPHDINTVMPDKWLLRTISGVSPAVCRELSFRAEDSFETLAETVDSFKQCLLNNECEPFLAIIQDRPIDFSCIRLNHLGEDIKHEKYSSFSDMLETFYTRRNKADILRRNSRELFKIVKNSRDRAQRKLLSQREELLKTENKDIICRQAELLKANIYRVKKGDRSICCEDYYEEGLPSVYIELDPLKTPAQNVEEKFKQYNKLKSAEKHLLILIKQTEEQLFYLNSVMTELECADNESDIGVIRSELTDTGYIKNYKSDKKRVDKQQKPLTFTSPDGFEIYVGRNNIQNDEISHKIAKKADYWFHAQKLHGSHVILCCGNSNPSDDDIVFAAELAAFFSQGRESSKVPVDYTRVRNIHKPVGALPGKVTYIEYHTINVSPTRHNI